MQNFLSNFSSVFNSPAFSGLYCILISLVILSQSPLHPILGVGSTRHNRSSKQQAAVATKTTTMQRRSLGDSDSGGYRPRKLGHDRDGDTTQG